MRRLKLLLAVGIAFYFGLVAIVYIAQRSMLYFPPQTYLAPQDIGLDAVMEIEFSTGTSSTAWWSAPDGNKFVIVFFHGNGSAVYSNHDIYKALIEKGYGVFAIGYPGYPGRTNGAAKPNQSDIAAQAIGQLEWLSEQGISDERIIYYGTSLGAGAAAQLSKTKSPALLILEAPFNSALDMARMRIPFLPVKMLMKYQYHSDEALKTVRAPMIWLHGTNDRVIPLSQGQKLYDGYQGPKTAHILQGGRHTDLWIRGGRDIIFDALANIESMSH